MRVLIILVYIRGDIASTIISFLQYFLYVLGNKAGARFRSAPTVLHDVRAMSSGTQSYDSNKLEWPVNEPIKKLEADIQVWLHIHTQF